MWRSFATVCDTSFGKAQRILGVIEHFWLWWDDSVVWRSCDQTQMQLVPLEGLFKHSLWGTPLLLYFQTDHCSKQCWGKAWAAWALEVQETTPGVLMMRGQRPCKWLPNLGGKSLQWLGLHNVNMEIVISVFNVILALHRIIIGLK